MENIINKKVGPLTILQLIAIIGGIIGAIALFLNCMEINFGFLGNATMTGWDFATEADMDDFRKYLPLIASIFAVLSIIIAAMPMIKPEMIKNASFLLILFSALIIIFTVVFGMVELTDLTDSTIFDNAGIGLWIYIISGILVLLCGIVDIVMSKSVAKSE